MRTPAVASVAADIVAAPLAVVADNTVAVAAPSSTVPAPRLAVPLHPTSRVRTPRAPRPVLHLHTSPCTHHRHAPIHHGRPRPRTLGSSLTTRSPRSSSTTPDARCTHQSPRVWMTDHLPCARARVQRVASVLARAFRVCACARVCRDTHTHHARPRPSSSSSTVVVVVVDRRARGGVRP